MHSPNFSGNQDVMKNSCGQRARLPPVFFVYDPLYQFFGFVTLTINTMNVIIKKGKNVQNIC